MKGRILDYWSRVRSSYWFIPAVMTVGAVVLSSFVIAIDDRFGVSWMPNLGWLYQNQPEGARAVLSSIAGSMITVAGVTFSMTLLAVSHASTQMGPRLLSGFMRDTGNQVTLGTFTATFVYCLLVLRTVRGGTTGSEDKDSISPFVPHLGVMVALALALASVAVLIYFFHHVPKTISVSHVIDRTGNELLAGIRTLFPKRIGAATEEPLDATAALEKLASRFPAGAGRVESVRKGYVRMIDAESISRAASEHDLVLEVLSRPGDFVYEGKPLLRVWPGSRLDEETETELRSAFTLGAQRSLVQDVMFPVDQLVELAIRALSPGVSDPFTAIECIHQLEAGVVELTRRTPPEACRIDEEGALRVVANPYLFGEIVDRIFNCLRRYGRHDAIVDEELLGAIERIAVFVESPADRHRLANHARYIHEGAATGLEDPQDRVRLTQVYERARAVLE